MTFDLTTLTAWTRRSCGDLARPVREQLIGDGSNVVSLSNEGSVTLSSVTIDNTPVTISTLTVSDNIVTFPTDVPLNSVVTATYSVTTYADTDIQSFIVDASFDVSADLGTTWTVADNVLSTTDTTVLTTDQSTLNNQIQRLIVMKAGIHVYGDKTDGASDDAIMVQDGDTRIDTSKTSAASLNRLKTKEQRYQDAMMDARARRMRGLSYDITRYSPTDVARPINLDPATWVPGDDFSPLT